MANWIVQFVNECSCMRQKVSTKLQCSCIIIFKIIGYFLVQLRTWYNILLSIILRIDETERSSVSLSLEVCDLCNCHLPRPTLPSRQYNAKSKSNHYLVLHPPARTTVSTLTTSLSQTFANRFVLLWQSTDHHMVQWKTKYKTPIKSLITSFNYHN